VVNRIEIDAFLSYLGEGMSKPALIMGDDLQRYILKTQKVMDKGKLVTHDCMFLNELLAYQIAQYLDVPVPEAAIANLDQRLIDNDPKITFVHRFYEGIHFASLELKDREDNLVENYAMELKMGKPYIVRSWNHFFDNILNANEIANIIAFDILIANYDRYGNTGNLLIANHDFGRKVFSIDHGHAFFSPVWNTDKMNALRAPVQSQGYVEEYVNSILGNNVIKRGFANGFGEVFRAIEPNIILDDPLIHSFQDVVAKIESINQNQIDQWFQNVPSEWFVDKQTQIAFLKQFILKQKDLVRHIIQNMAYRNAFSNYRGGVLQWKAAKHVGTV
jgi:hypothetical protein